MDRTRGAVSVDIYGASYTISGEGSPAEIRSLARYVDETMRQIASASGLTDSLKVAVLTALHIADDLHRAKLQLSELESSVSGAARQCSSLLDQILETNSPSKGT